MTTTNLIIAILLALATATSGLCIFLANMAIRELNEVIEKLYRKVDTLQHNSDVLMQNVQKLEAEKAKREQLGDAIRENILRNLAKRNGINVVGKDKPLDFPNGD